MTARLPTETVDALKRAVEAGLRSLKADPPVPYSVWAAEHFDLDEESSHQRGLFVPWPFQIGWMDAFSNDDIEEVNVEKAKRVGYTKTVVGFAEYNAAHRRRKLAIWQPTDDDRDSFVKSEITPSFDICRRLDQVKHPGPGYIHLNRHLPPEWFDQLTAEHRIKVRMAHGWADRWVCPGGNRNEVLDGTVIVLFLAQAMGYQHHARQHVAAMA